MQKLMPCNTFSDLQEILKAIFFSQGNTAAKNHTSIPFQNHARKSHLIPNPDSHILYLM